MSVYGHNPNFDPNLDWYCDALHQSLAVFEIVTKPNKHKINDH